MQLIDDLPSIIVTVSTDGIWPRLIVCWHLPYFLPLPSSRSLLHSLPRPTSSPHLGVASPSPSPFLSPFSATTLKTKCPGSREKRSPCWRRCQESRCRGWGVSAVDDWMKQGLTWVCSKTERRTSTKYNKLCQMEQTFLIKIDWPQLLQMGLSVPCMGAAIHWCVNVWVHGWMKGHCKALCTGAGKNTF